jgi:hypothetical protein
MNIEPKNFTSIGYLETKLNKDEMSYLWSLVKNHAESVKYRLVGHISNSFKLVDTDNWFFNTVVLKHCEAFAHYFTNTLGDSIPISQKHPYFLEAFWVNFQKQGEFNPLHNHYGVYSFVIWMNIPTDFEEQNKKPIAQDSNDKLVSAFTINYIDPIGRPAHIRYKLDKSYEGTMLFFPSQLPHCVYPFYDCDEDRISISGNIALDTKILLNT